ncbi:Ammonia channel [Thermoflexales bacterium]|nr:Ammonia channel [Thermoflexales bacterium]
MDLGPLLLAYLLPLGLILVTWGAWDSARVRDYAVTALLVSTAAILAYAVCGFALQFGGIGLRPDVPAGLRGLDRMWSPVSSTTGSWGMMGLEGFLLQVESTLPGDTALVFTLFLHQLPVVIAAALLPGLALAGRVRSGIIAAISILTAGFIIPLAGAWSWGGGWLSTLGLDAKLGHGLIDPGGSTSSFLAAGFVTLAALLALRLKRPVEAISSDAESSALVGPARSISGALLFLVGWLLWIVTNPIVKTIPSIDLSLVMANTLSGAAAATIVALFFGWFFSGKPNIPLATRGVIGGLIVSTPLAPFAPTWSALVTGAIGGLLIAFGSVAVERWLRYEDGSGAVATAALGGVWSLLVVGLFANGMYGSPWNNVGVNEYLGVSGQGVTGLIAGANLPNDPGQFTAQLTGAIAIALLAFIITWLLTRPLRGLNNR